MRGFGLESFLGIFMLHFERSFRVLVLLDSKSLSLTCMHTCNET